MAGKIQSYKRRHPDQEVNLIALSAGTGVVVWALERLKGRCQVDNVFLLASSLSSNYNMTKALPSVKGKIYVYYSRNDGMLNIIPWVGMSTVDGKLFAKTAGQAGLRGRGAKSGKIVNIGWEPKWGKVSWQGGHTDCVRRDFVQHELAPKLMGRRLPPGDSMATAAQGDEPTAE